MGGCAASEVDGADGGAEEGLPLVHLANQGLDVLWGLVAQGGGVEVAIDAAKLNVIISKNKFNTFSYHCYLNNNYYLFFFFNNINNKIIIFH